MDMEPEIEFGKLKKGAWKEGDPFGGKRYKTSVQVNSKKGHQKKTKGSYSYMFKNKLEMEREEESAFKKKSRREVFQEEGTRGRFESEDSGYG
jgi:hypothetical protein